MAQLPPLRPIVNNTPADADDVRANFEQIERNVNTEVINRDGSITMQAPLSGPPGTQPNHYVTVGQLNTGGGGQQPGDGLGLPAGMLAPFAGGILPVGWDFCRGQAVSTTDPKYVALFAAIGYAYGDPGSGNFNLPDLRGKCLVGAGSGLDPSTGGALPQVDVGVAGGNADQGPEHTHTTLPHFHTLGNHVHGLARHTHTINPHRHEIGAHNHTIPGHQHSIDHNHGQFNSGYDTHNHVLGGENQSIIEAGSGFKHAPESGANRTTRGLNTLNSGNNTHRHTVDVPNYSGLSGPGNATNTGSRSLLTGIPLDQGTSQPSDNESGTPDPNSGDPAVVTVENHGVSNGNYPPFVGVNYIIKL